MVSTTEEAFDVDVVRISRGENQNGHPGVHEELVPGIPIERLSGGEQTTRRGSYIRVPGIGHDLRSLDTCTVALWIWPTLLNGRHEQVVISTLSATSGVGWELVIDDHGRAALRMYGDRGSTVLKLDERMRLRRWYEIVAGYDLGTGESLLAVRDGARQGHTVVTSRAGLGRFEQMATDLIMAARDDTSEGPERRTKAHFNGRLEDVCLLEQAPVTLAGEPREGDDSSRVLARWDFADDPSASSVKDQGPLGRHGIVVNRPTRAVTGHRWNGDVHDVRQAPQHYAAIHFHEDDIQEAGWDTSFTLSVPDDLRSGVYAARCRSRDLVDHVPFVVIPAPDAPRAPAAVVLSSFTYLAYANMRQGLEVDFQSRKTVGREVTHDPSLDLLRDHPEWGMSLYDVHSDGSGSIYASWERPLLSLRPGYTNWVTGGPREFSADLCLIHWLDRQGIEVDVLTDAELHEHGIEALKPYSVVMTGSHPEYSTESMGRALDEYVERGGRLMYLGGNGFYWVTSVDPSQPGIIEVRRGQSGTRSWTSMPGELHHSTTGEYGGLWRHRGRPPNELVGVGFTGQGWDVRAGCYERLESSRGPDYNWIFDGVGENETIGDFGLAMDGSAGDEIDRHDAMLGGSGATVIASSVGHSDHYCVAVEELMQTTPDVTAPTNHLVRADMVYWKKGKGAVYSVGSMSWIPALPVDGCKNNVSRITANVLGRFICDGQLDTDPQ